jgi:hypothetical protein
LLQGWGKVGYEWDEQVLKLDFQALGLGFVRFGVSGLVN